ncbi:MAG: hypothetical protein ACJ72N_13990 [Labedaea sp.]
MEKKASEAGETQQDHDHPAPQQPAHRSRNHLVPDRVLSKIHDIVPWRGDSAKSKSAHMGQLGVAQLIHNLNIRVLDTTTGALLRELTHAPTKDYQPQQHSRPNP